MPLRQTLLSFAGSAAVASGLMSSLSAKTRPTPSRTDSSSTADLEDTITVAVPDETPQLPTPSESATDVSSQTTDTISMKEVPKGRARRVSRRRTKSQDGDYLLEGPNDDHAQDRAVSGETLVNGGNMSQASIMKDGIAALNLPWSMSEVFETGSKAELLRRKDTEPRASTDTLHTLTPNDEAEKESREQAAAKKAKIEENKKIREERWKAEDAKATRRSSRASMLTKASDMVSDITATVLGKRKDRVSELRGTLRPRSVMDTMSSGESLSEPDSKRRRLSENAVPMSTQPSSSRKVIRAPKDKKWLTSGLFVGQARTFEPRLTESKNKRKSSATSTNPALEKENTVLPLPMFAGDRLLKFGRDFKLPFDVFSPLPAGQPKPDEWRKSNKNTFVGDASQEWRISKFIEHSTCMCHPESGCDHNCMNRFMYYECDERNCNLAAEACGNRAFEGLRQRSKKGGKYNIGVEVVKTVNRGNGVRSNRTFEPNQIIVEYTGEIVTQEECERRMHETYKENESYYLMLFDQNMVIDATTRGSIARFVNHSCNPNCRMEKWTVGGQPRMALFAGDRGIMTGEELTYDYNFDPYSLKNVQECRCGEKGCRGVLGPKLKEERAKEIENEGKLKGVKRKIVEVVEEGFGAAAKKRKMVGVKEVKTTTNTTMTRSPRINGTPKRKHLMGKVKLVKKSVRRSTSARVPSAGLSRNPLKLKTLLGRAGSLKSVKSSKSASSVKSVRTARTMRIPGKNRVTSGASAEALLNKENDSERVKGSGKGKVLGRSASLREKVGSLRNGVARSVRR